MSNIKMFEEVLFTHNDLDGAGCSVIYALAHPSTAVESNRWKIYNCSNEGVDRTVKEAIDSGEVGKDTKVTFADIICCREHLQWLVDNCASVEIYDHHNTNLWADTICPNAVIISKTATGVPTCGTSLLYQNYAQLTFYDPENKRWSEFDTNNDETHKSLLTQFVDTIRSYDTWEWKSTNNILAKHLQTLFSLLGIKEFISSYIKVLRVGSGVSNLIPDSDYRFINARINSEKERMDKFDMSKVDLCTIRGLRTALALNTVGCNVSDLSSMFLEKYPDIDMFVSFFFADGTLQFRTRRDDINLGKYIAEPMGGGGHPQAAGAVISDDLKELFKLLLIAAMNGDEIEYKHLTKVEGVDY